LRKLTPESFDFLANSHHFVSSSFDLDERLFSLFVKITALLDIFDKPCCKKANGDWVNVSPQMP
jgi:hypothetical protein